MTTPNMLLVLPTDHGSAEVWDVILDTVFNTIDSHDHTPGKGALISASAVKVAADKSWSFGGTSYAITDLKAIDFVPVASTTVTSLAGAFFVSDGTGGLTANELYFRTTSGVNVKFTSGAALNVAAFTGGIGGDYSAVGAAVAYDDSLDRYTFKQQGNVWARMASGEVRILETGSSDSVYVGHAAPAALAASYTVTWPLALPGSTQLAQVDSSGVTTWSNTIVNAVTMSSTLGVTGLITATAGATAAANQHVTISGTGRFKHGTYTLSVPWTAFVQIASGTAVAYSTAIGSPGITGATFIVEAPVMLPVGARILTVRTYFSDSAVGPTKLQSSLISCSSTGTIALTAGPSAQSLGNGTNQSATLSAINVTIASLSSYSILVQTATGAAAVAVFMAEVDYDYP